MASWDHYAELDVTVMDKMHVHAGYAKDNLVFFSGSNDVGLRVLLVSDVSPSKLSDSYLKATDESTILGLVASGKTRSMVFEPHLSPEPIIECIIADVQDQRNLPYAARRALIAQYEPDPQLSHELAVHQEAGAFFLKGKSSHTRVVTPDDVVGHVQPEP